MAQVTSGIRAILSSPHVYTLFQNLMGARSGWRRIVAQDIRPRPSDLILDVGCGPADILDYLPALTYWGFDISRAYIDMAQRKYGTRGNFRCKLLEWGDLPTLPKFDVVVASGLLHHLDDGQALDLMRLARQALKPGGRMVTIDPCLVPGQHPVARFLIERDRGRNVRHEAAYAALAAPVFERVEVKVRHKVWIPYTHCIMECTNA